MRARPNAWATPKRRILTLTALTALVAAGLVAGKLTGREATPTAKPSLTSGRPAAPNAALATTDASSTGLPGWVIVGGMVAVAGTFGALSLRRRRVARKTETSLPAAAAKMCPTCKMSFPPAQGFCPADGNALVQMVSSLAPRGKIGGVCPTCTQGFDPGVEKCPVDGDSLIPAPVFQTVFPGNCGHDAGEKICPQCGTRTSPPSRFCETDGTELRPLH